MKDIILIGGAEGMGKSTLAKQLAAHFQVPWISTDQIRTILRIEEPDEAKRMELIWQGVATLVKSPHPWEGAVIEGTAILPDFVKQDLEEVGYVIPIYLTQDDREYAKAQEVLGIDSETEHTLERLDSNI
jgi:2-phosphoglycerate kinase